MYGKIPRSPEPPALITTEPPQLGPRHVVIRKDVQVPSFLMVYHAPSCTDPDFPAMRVLDIVLLQGESSRLYRKLVADLELCLSVYGGIGETVDPLLFTIEREIESELDRLVREGITPREFEKAMNTIRTDFYGPLQSIAGKANALGQTEVLYGGYENLFVMMDRYKALDLEKIRQAAAKYFTENNKTVGKVLPQGGGHEE
jgi:predicted Zn-dependent peptidase